MHKSTFLDEPVPEKNMRKSTKKNSPLPEAIREVPDGTVLLHALCNVVTSRSLAVLWQHYIK
jgi:hypothetical protein